MADPRPAGPWPAEIAANLLAWAAERAEGYRPPMIQEVFRSHGVWRGMAILSKIGEVRRRVEAHFGIADGHLLMAFAAFWDGCTYCSRGHLLTSNVARHHYEGVVFPIAFTELMELRRRPDAAVIDTVTGTLATDPRLARAAALVERQYRLKAGHETPTRTQRDDTLTMATLSAWSWLTECTVMVDEREPVVVMAPELNRDPQILAAYRAARAARSDAPP